MFVENVLCKMRIEHGAGTIRVFLRRKGVDCEEVLTIENCGNMPFIRQGDKHFKIDLLKCGLDIDQNANSSGQATENRVKSPNDTSQDSER